LHNFPVDTIKIDRSFVQALPADKKAIAIVDAVCRLGINLGITIVAEGVETKAQIRYLSNSNCTMLQGYLLGKPVPECDIHPGSKPFKQSAA
jgi:EAL domain-containing protein (putative c-di-GMP-specific phosphodiesterase class I)